MPNQADKIEKRRAYIDKTNYLLNKQFETKNFLQNTSIGLIGFVTLITTIIIVLLKESNYYIKILAIIPIFIFGIATYKLLGNLERRSLFMGPNTVQIEKHINESFGNNLKFILSSNISALNNNKLRIDNLGDNLNSAIKWILISLSLIILLFIVDNLCFENQEEKKSINLINFNFMTDNNSGEKFQSSDLETEEEIYPVDQDSLMATEKEFKKKKEKKNNKKKEKD
ncbi:MAG: hypothetical protein ACSHW7_02200 [Patiriisocius sp.]|uniref:hypothetical protein n=1 Tax=Patiriisocius sp. TaxID=2822396 RepID=UPI003EF5F88E